MYVDVYIVPSNDRHTPHASVPQVAADMAMLGRQCVLGSMDGRTTDMQVHILQQLIMQVQGPLGEPLIGA